MEPIETEHEFFSKGYADDAFGRKVHVHLCRAGSRWERRHLAFRDWLRAHPEDAARVNREWAEASAHGRDSVIEYRFVCPDGTNRNVPNNRS